MTVKATQSSSIGIFQAVLEVVGALVFHSCRHKNMSWPICLDGYSYQVCLDCGIKRLFDEETLRGYGRCGHDLDALLGRRVR